MEHAVAALADAGFDLAHGFDVDVVAREPGLERLASAGPERAGLLVGNTRALWPKFVEAMRDPALAADPDPLERYTERTLSAIFGDARIYYGHRHYDGAFLPLQRLAVASGLGALAASHLVIHPIYGPWFALRAAVVIAGPAPAALPVIAQPCQCAAACTQALAAALASRADKRAWLAVRDACTLRAWRYGEDQLR
ncbi:MAG: Ferredoxin, partial [Deltaproteobacteria bacterium]|nr:Ferredoxin [Deltaproteobacteria bacterium]